MQRKKTNDNRTETVAANPRGQAKLVLEIYAKT
jgi:hypothetical protein